MAEEKVNLPEQYHRSRTTALLTSIAAFFVSMPAAGLKFQFTGVEITGLSKPFLIIALLTASAVSLVSLYLSYKTEGMRYALSRIDQLRRGVSGAEFEIAAKEMLDNLEATHNQIIKAAETLKLDETGYGTSRLGSRQAEDVKAWMTNKNFMQHFIEEPFISAGNTAMVDLPRENWPENLKVYQTYMDRVQSSMKRTYLETVETFIRNLDGDDFRKDIGEVLKYVEEGDTLRLRYLDRLLDIPKAQREILRRAERPVRWEVGYWGLGIPAFVFFVALLHGIGGIGFKYAPSLPHCVESIIAALAK